MKLCANLFHTMYEIMDAASKGEDYDSIELYEEVCGRMIERVVLYSEQDELHGMRDRRQVIQ